jgi:hypothetical protein
MTMLETINNAWKWAGLVASSIEATNLFGNVIVRSLDGCYWRICPEELSAQIIARNDQGYTTLWNDADFRLDREMKTLVDMASAVLGPPDESRCYCLKRPAVLGGGYVSENLSTISRIELVSFAGYLAEQIKDLPDGAEIKLVLSQTGQAP